MDARWLLDALRTGGPAVGLVFLAIVFAFLRGTIHTDREFRAMKDDRDFWRAEALDALSTGERAVNAATEIARKSRRRPRAGT